MKISKFLLLFVNCFFCYNFIYGSDNELTVSKLTLQRFPDEDFSPVLSILSDLGSQYPMLSVSFDDNDHFAGPYFKTLYVSHGYYWTPINFEASSYNFRFGEGINGTMNVDGKIVCKEELKVAEIDTKKIKTKSVKADNVNVMMNNVADYVFDDNYELKSLSDVEAYVKENKHLPGIPSAKEFSENGMNVSEMSNLLLEKIEELTLHIIKLQKELDDLKGRENK